MTGNIRGNRAKGSITIASRQHAPDAPDITDVRSARAVGSWPVVLAAGSLGATLIHAAVVADHGGLSWLFAAAAAVQGAWALAVIFDPGRPVLSLGLAFNTAAVVAYLFSRTTGLPGLEAVEPFDAAGVICALFEIAVVVVVAYLLSPRTVLPSYRRLGQTAAASVAVLVAVVAVPGLVATGGDHPHDAGARDDATGGIRSSHDHAAVDTVAQRRADALVHDTARLTDRWKDVAQARRDGYASLNHGLIDHWVNWDLVDTPETLDPRHPESLVYVRRPDDSLKLVAVMYIAPWDMATHQVPIVANATWHTHPDLCMDDNRRLASFASANGTCPVGALRPLPPMLHVSLVPNECGTFGDPMLGRDATTMEARTRFADALRRTPLPPPSTTTSDPCAHEHHEVPDSRALPRPKLAQRTAITDEP